MSKIVLRPWQKEDAQALAAIANNRKVWDNVRDFFPTPYTVLDAEQWLDSIRKTRPFLNFAILYQGRIAGNIGIVPKEDVYRMSVEIGYFIGEEFWGKGIATEATRLLVEYIEQEFNVVRIYAEVFETNKASMRVLQKNGFYLEGIRRKAVIKNGEIMDDYVWVKLIK
ncbi:MAG: GNAT family N-acetyltransferase [Chitinophagaceae bacterium]|nr:GNAT family N-acetyltransferase [Chitinophagaceae bacterium]